MDRGGLSMRIGGFIALVISGAIVPSALAEDTAPRGIVRAVNEAWISSDLGFEIVDLPVREGDSFVMGDRLAAFDCEALRAEAKAAEAKHDAEALTYANNKKLAELKAVGRFEVGLSQAREKEMAAQVEAYRIRLGHCEIVAPFPGRVSELRVHAHEVPERLQPIMHIIETSTLEIDIILPSAWLRWLKTGAQFTMKIEETGATLKAEVARIGAAVDPVSQTIKVVARFTDDAKNILPGMTGTVMFAVPNG
jgi:membrane fusion protein, multidrug efflux system